MKKAIFVAAAFTVVAISTSIAQVYSVNAVGYVTITIPSGYCMFGNPLNNSNNSVNAVLPLPPGSEGVTIFRFDCVAQSYLDAIQFVDGFGWFSPSDPDPTLNPGEGFFVYSPLPAPIGIAMIGDVPQGNLTTPVPGGGRYCIKSAVVPKTARLGCDSTWSATHGFPCDDGDTVFIFDCALQQYKDAYQYVGDFGWFSASDPLATPDGPEIVPGQGFFIQKIAPSRVWSISFSVN